MERDRMRHSVLVILLMIMLLPLVSAEEVSYYPDHDAFLRFLESKTPYKVIAGRDGWSRGWAYYVDEKLSIVKPRGDGTLVLVGNVQNNKLMASLWNRTGLPPEYSFLPSVIVLNDTVMITGSEENIYLTEKAFEHLWNPPLTSIAVGVFVTLLLTATFLLTFKREGGHVVGFYIPTIFLFLLWYLTANRPPLTEGFLHYMFKALKFSVGGSADSPLSAIMGAAFKVIPPIEENIILVHWILVLLMLSLTFYLAPKRSRELGFIAFGLVFVAPMFRSSLESINGSALGLASFLSILVMISNVTFSPEKWKALLQTAILSALTLIAVAVNPYLVLIPLIFIATFPKRYLRNYTYLLITSLGVIAMYTEFGLPLTMSWTPNPEGFSMMKVFLMNSALPLVSIIYALGSRKGVKMKGQTAFLLLMAIVYVPMTLFVPDLFPYCFIILSALTVRLIHSLSSGT